MGAAAPRHAFATAHGDSLRRTALPDTLRPTGPDPPPGQNHHRFGRSMNPRFFR